MIQAEVVIGLIQQKLSESGLFLVDVLVRPGNKILVLLDSMQGVTIDECMMVSRLIEKNLDRDKEDYDLEVSSPGLDRPLKLPFQYEKNIGRTLDVVLTDGEKLKGKLLSVTPQGLQLEQEMICKDPKTGKKKKETLAQEINFQEIKTAKIELSLKRNK
jgi:ribosome maturation factor RimP